MAGHFFWHPTSATEHRDLVCGAIRKIIDIFWRLEGAGVAADLDPPRLWTPSPNPLADMDPPQNLYLNDDNFPVFQCSYVQLSAAEGIHYM